MRRNTVFLTFAVCFGVTVWNIARPTSGGEPSDQRDAVWVGKRVEAWQPTKEERAFDGIGWAKNLREAQQLAQKHQRPVFLFTYDGASLSDYRC